MASCGGLAGLAMRGWLAWLPLLVAALMQSGTSVASAASAASSAASAAIRASGALSAATRASSPLSAAMTTATQSSAATTVNPTSSSRTTRPMRRGTPDTPTPATPTSRSSAAMADTDTLAVHSAGTPIHVISGPLIDDEDPPLPSPSSPEEEDLPLVPSWIPREAKVASSSGLDEAMDVRSNNPSHGARSPQTDPNSLYQEAASPSPSSLDDDQGHPSWYLVNTRRCGLSKSSSSPRIVGGAMAPLGQYPWLARMGYILEDSPRRVYRCAGAVITHLYVLTAAHCVKNLPQNFDFVGVRLGEWDTTTDPDCQNSVCAPAVYDVDPEAIIVHQEYNSPRFANDIALVRLAQKINFNGWVAPVCIPYGDLLAKSYESEKTEVAGWGIYDINLQKSSQELRMVHLPVVSNSVCHALYRNQANITKKQMCAGGELGSDACSGDSGGPLLKVEAYNVEPRYYIVGIVSFGSKRCGLTPAPGVYTRVSFYVDWILDNIEPA